MKHPVVLIIPVLMLCDYYLTIIGGILHERGYGRHIKIEQYVLNPIWQSNAKKPKWFNVRHLILFIPMSLFLIYASEAINVPSSIEMFIFGLLVMHFSAIIGRHFSNILIFRHAIKHPEEISGQTQLSHKMVSKISQYQILLALCPFAAIALFVQTPFVLGGFCGILNYFVLHSIWLGMYKRRLKKHKSPN